MLKQACPSCGAHNGADAIFCWQCHERFPGTYYPPSIFRGLNQRAHSGYFAPTGTSPPTTTPFAVGLTKRLALLGALWIAGLLTWNAIVAGFPFPDQISGEERVESSPVDSGVQLVQDMIAATGLDVDVDFAFYGNSDTQPKYMMFVAESDEDSVERLFETQAPVISGTPRAMECTWDRTGSICLWFQDEAMMGLYGWGEPFRVLHVTARYLRNHLD